MISRRERRLIASLSHQPLERLVDSCRSDRHREKFAHLSQESFDLVIKREYPRFLALKTFCRDYTHPRFVAPSQLIGLVWKIHVVDEDDYETLCRSIHNGHLVGQDADSTPGSDDEDIENPGKFRLILYPQPEHRSEENKWTKKALAMTRRLYRLYFNEAPPMDIWGDDRVLPNPMVVEPVDRPVQDQNHRRTDIERTSLPMSPQRQTQKNQAVIKRELPEEQNSPVSSRSLNSARRRGSPSRGNSSSSTPLRRMTVSAVEDQTPSTPTYHPLDPTPSTSSGISRRAANSAQKRTHGSPHERPSTAWITNNSALNHYGLFRPALRRRRISHEGLLLIVPITPNTSGASTAPKLTQHLPHVVRASSDSYNVDTPFQVYMSVFDTVRQLKEKIWSEKNVPVNRQVIWFNDNAVVNETQKLADLGVAVGDLDDGLGSSNEGKDVIGLQVIKDLKVEPEDQVLKKTATPKGDGKGG